MQCVWRPCESCRQWTGLSVFCVLDCRCLKHLPKPSLQHTHCALNVAASSSKHKQMKKPKPQVWIPGFIEKKKKSKKSLRGFCSWNWSDFQCGTFWLHTQNKEESALLSAKVVSLKHSWHSTNVAGFSLFFNMCFPFSVGFKKTTGKAEGWWSLRAVVSTGDSSFTSSTIRIVQNLNITKEPVKETAKL